MLLDVENLISDFIEVASISGFYVNRDDILYQALPAPHNPVNLPKNKQAVYVFSMPASNNKILKVGKVGPKSNARFLSQHYNPKSSNSNLSASLLKHPEMWMQLGISGGINLSSVGDWLKQNTDRENFYLDIRHGKYLLSLLEIFLQSRFNPIFEG